MRDTVFINYYTDFTCLGDKCTANCCNSWNIKIDSATRKKYLEIDTKNNTEISKNIIATDKNGEFKIKLTKEGQCPFLAPSGLCNIVGNYGPDALSDTCHSYPRQGYLLKNSDRMFASMSLSCPEVVRLSLQKDKPLSYIEQQASYNPGVIHHTYTHQTTSKQLEDKQLNIHNTIVKIISLREIPLETRLTAVLLIASKIDQIDYKSQKNLEVINSLAESLLSSKLSSIPKLQGNKSNKLFILTHVFRTFHKSLSISKKIPLNQKALESFSKAIQGLDINNTEMLVESYSKLEKEYLDKWEEINPFFWENFYSHHCLTNFFPFGFDYSALHTFMKFCIIAMLIEGLAIGIHNLNKNSFNDEILEACWLVHRLVNHNKSIQDLIVNICEKISANSVGQIYTMFAK